MAQTRILYVEDYPVVQVMYLDVLKKHFDVDLADDGNDALAKVMQNKYDFVLLDLLLPELSGLKFLQEYNKLLPTPHTNTTVVVLTDFDSPETRQEVTKLGVKHYWIKVETTPHVLIEKLQKLNKHE